MPLSIENIIYFYLFICLALLVFNVLYIFRSQSRNKAQARKGQLWEKELLYELTLLEQGKGLSDRQRKRMVNQLSDINELIACNETLSRISQKEPRQIRTYFLMTREAWQQLAVIYSKKSAMERAFFAYMIATYHPPQQRGSNMLVEIFLTYLDNSTVFCRENVLHALYTLGSVQGVEHALQILNDRNWYHYPRLLSDGMLAFKGDREALVRRLWRHHQQWAEFLLVATVQLAAGLSADFTAEFFSCLQKESLPLEVRFALIRYFQRHPYEPAQKLLLHYLTTSEGEESGLAIAAAAAMASYPGESSRNALKKALHSKNWYVRRNAALSLVSLGLSEQEQREIETTGDRYASEMLAYALASQKAGKAVGQA